MARPIERPSARQRLSDGNGCCTVLISTGTIFTGQVAPGHISDIGIVTAWSISMS